MRVVTNRISETHTKLKQYARNSIISYTKISHYSQNMRLVEFIKLSLWKGFIDSGFESEMLVMLSFNLWFYSLYHRVRFRVHVGHNFYLYGRRVLVRGLFNAPPTLLAACSVGSGTGT